MAGRLEVPDDDDGGRIVLLVHEYCGLPRDGVARGTGRLQLQTADGSAVSGVVAVCQQLARASGKAEQLLGAQPAQQAQVLQWLTWTSSELLPPTDDKLSALSAALAAKTYLAGGAAASLADLVVFGAVHPAVSALPPAQLDGLANLLRWFDLMQHTAGRSELFAPVAVQLPAFVPPPPPPAPPAASSKPAASAASTATGQQGTGGGKKDKAATAAGGGSSSSSSTAAAAAAAAGTAAAAGGAAAAAAAAGGKAGGKEAKQKEGKAPKEVKEGAKQKEGGGGGKAPKEAEEARIDMIDIRVGRIVSVQQHPNADALYLEEIDVGEDKPRQVISGLVKFVPRDQMENRRVVVCCNLKPAKMRDIMSYGMVLCASTDAHDKVDPIVPPEGVPVGERITFEGYTNAPLEEVNPKRKILERLFPDLTTNADGVPTYKGVPFMTSKGPVTSTIPNAHVG